MADRNARGHPRQDEVESGREMRLGREETSKLGRDMFDLQTAILAEVQHVKDDTSRQLRENTRSLKDATSEISNLCDDLNRQMKQLVAATKASRLISFSSCKGFFCVSQSHP